ncbi:MAG TPA: hypothetical protein VI756_22120 [Blastocatellia bacterium]
MLQGDGGQNQAGLGPRATKFQRLDGPIWMLEMMAQDHELVNGLDWQPFIQVIRRAPRRRIVGFESVGELGLGNEVSVVDVSNIPSGD